MARRCTGGSRLHRGCTAAKINRRTFCCDTAAVSLDRESGWSVSRDIERGCERLSGTTHLQWRAAEAWTRVRGGWEKGRGCVKAGEQIVIKEFYTFIKEVNNEWKAGAQHDARWWSTRGKERGCVFFPRLKTLEAFGSAKQLIRLFSSANIVSFLCLWRQTQLLYFPKTAKEPPPFRKMLRSVISEDSPFWT